MLSLDQQLVEFFADRLALKQQTHKTVAESLASLKPDLLLRFQEPVKRLRTKADAKALLKTLKYERAQLIANHKYHLLGMGEISTPNDLREFTEITLGMACSSYNAAIGKLIRVASKLNLSEIA